HLQVDSYIRPNRLFTADTNIIDRQAGQISTDKLNEVISMIKSILDKNQDE
ncbi:MAG: type II toxin-antitoxin system PemK/MazF family toxin, partial [Chloroflexi bacterium]